MAKKKSKGEANNRIVHRWNNYFKEDTIENWQRLMTDLGMEGTFSSKTQCRKALKKIWVNIRDFLDAVAAGTTVRRFRSQAALGTYTRETGRFYPKKKICKGSPLEALLAYVA